MNISVLYCYSTYILRIEIDAKKTLKILFAITHRVSYQALNLELIKVSLTLHMRLCLCCSFIYKKVSPLNVK